MPEQFYLFQACKAKIDFMFQVILEDEIDANKTFLQSNDKILIVFSSL